MEWVVQMGFELETYQPDELAGMYWYLQYLTKTRSRHLERIRGFTARTFSASSTQPQSKSAKSALQQSELVNAISYINFSMLEAASTYGFADALSCLFTVLSRLSLIPKQSRPYSDDAMRYELRMKPFLSVGLPELPPFEEFTQYTRQPQESTLDLLDFAAESTSGAKKGLEILSKLNAKDAYCQGSYESWVKNVRDCLKACIFTSITISAVKKAVEAAAKDGKVKLKVEIPRPEKGYHKWW